MTARHHHAENIDTPSRSVPRIALRPQEAADSIGVSLGTFLVWVKDGKMPRPIKIGRIALYDIEAMRRAWEALKESTGSGDLNPWDE